MKTKLLTFITALAVPALLLASVADPIADFKTGLTIPTGDKILKWACDINGDGKDEILLCLKSDFDKAAQDNEAPSWDFYISETSGTGYSKPTGIEVKPGAVSCILPTIDSDVCFIGQIAQLNKRGIVTITYATQRSGVTTATIYAYTIEGDHLKRTELGHYDPDKMTPPLFKQYLADDKRTHVTLQEVTP
jgi:hypothetical protein